MKVLLSFLVLFFVIFLPGCKNDQDDSSAFAEILNQPPFNKITDSINNSGKDPELYFRRAVLLNTNNQPVPALADFKKAWSLSKKEIYAVGISNILIDQQKDSAVSFLETATKELSKSIFLKLMLSRGYDAQNKTNDALRLVKEILAEDSLQVNAIVLKSDLLLKTNATKEAMNELMKAYRLVPTNRDVSNKLIYLFAENKDPRALSMADTLISHDEARQFAEPYYVKGVYYSNIKEASNAIHWFDETIKTDHRFLNAYIEKGKVLIDQKKYPDALSTFQLANRISPAFPDAWYWMAQVQEKLGDKDSAIDNYEKAFGLDKSFVEAREAAERLGSK